MFINITVLNYLFFQDSVKNFIALDEVQQNYNVYLGPFLNPILYIRQCPVNKMKLCITSDPEWEKCIKMMVSTKVN